MKSGREKEEKLVRDADSATNGNSHDDHRSLIWMAVLK